MQDVRRYVGHSLCKISVLAAWLDKVESDHAGGVSWDRLGGLWCVGGGAKRWTPQPEACCSAFARLEIDIHINSPQLFPKAFFRHVRAFNIE